MTHAEWNVADAKSKLSEVLNRAEQKAQFIRRRGHEYVVLDAEEYNKLTGLTRTFLDHLISGGPRADELEPMPRDQTYLREVDL